MVINMNGDRIASVELWGGSTKHPDVVYYYEEEVSSKRYIPTNNPNYDKYQFCLYIASRAGFAPHSVAIAREAFDNLITDVAKDDNCTRREARKTVGILALA